MKFSMETFLRVYSDDDGYYWEIRSDAEGLECVELIYSDNLTHSKPKSLTSFQPDAARLVAAALIQIADEIDEARTKAAATT
jgi:hypothetical protein